MLGHDNPIWFDQLIMGKWHFAHQGLFPFRFSPHACAGAPVYGDPESVYYSLAQLLSLYIQPWFAMQISVIIALIAGYFGWLQFGKKVVRLKHSWAQLLAMVMIGNGFIFIHLAVGHFQMHTMPLIGWFLFLLFDRDENSRINLLTRSSIFGLLAVYTLCNAGYNVLLFTAITAIFVLPFDLIFSSAWKNRIKEVLKRAAGAGTISLLGISSKLVAVLSFMRYFPRVEGYSPMWQSANIFVYIAQSFWSIFPTRESIFGYGWDVHEKMIPLSPVTYIGLIVGVYLLFKKKEWIKANIQRSAIIGATALFTFLFLTQLAQGRGFLVASILKLPVISSLRVASRFLYIFSIFISILSVYCIAIYSETWNDKWKKLAPKLGIVLSLFVFITGWDAVRNKLFLIEDYDQRIMQVNSLHESHYEEKAVTEVKDGNTDFIKAGNVCHIELLRKTFPLPVMVMETKIQYGGAFNLMNPACYQYPTENNCKPGDRIKVEDQQNFENFSKGLPTTWKLSTLQHVADYTSLITVLFCVGFLFSRWRKRSTAL